jgi:hypothetical protein
MAMNDKIAEDSLVMGTSCNEGKVLDVALSLKKKKIPGKT